MQVTTQSHLPAIERDKPSGREEGRLREPAGSACGDPARKRTNEGQAAVARKRGREGKGRDGKGRRQRGRRIWLGWRAGEGVRMFWGSASRLVLLDVLLALDIGGLRADLLVVLLQRGQVLAGLGELTLLHTLADVPVHEGTLAVHQVELVVNAGEHLRDRRAVAHHAHRALHLGQVPAGYHRGGLVVDPALEPGGAPVHELDRALRLDRRHAGVDVLRHHVPTVHQAARHVLPVPRVALRHHAGGLKHGVGDLRHAELLVVRLLRADDRGPRAHHEVDAGVRHQVGLELRDINVQRAVEPQGGGQAADHLPDQPVQVGVRRALDVQVAAADVVQGLVVHHKRHVSVLQQTVRRQHAVVGLHHRRGHLRRGVDAEVQLGLLAVVHAEALQQQRAQTRPRAPAHRVEAQEALQPRAVVRQLADPVQAQVHDLLPDGVVPSGVVVRRVLLAADQLLRVEQLAVGPRADLIDHGGLQVQKHAPRHVLPRPGLREERVEGIVLHPNGLVRGHRAVGLDPVLQAVQLPAGIPGLDPSLPNVDRDNFTHCEDTKKLALEKMIT
eukprot:RCo013467